MSVKTKYENKHHLKKTGLFVTGLLTFLFLFLALMNEGFSMEQNNLRSGPNRKLSRADKKIMKLIQKEFSIDKSTFCNTTPDSNDPYWIESLRRYQAMNKDWITCDPPGPPATFIVTRSNKIFRDLTKALHSMQYVPKNDQDALKIAMMIANEDSPDGATVIMDGSEKVNGVPQSVLSKYTIAPSLVKSNQTYQITVFSYVSRENENHFVHAYHTLWQHLITIEGDTYKDIIKVLWEKRD